MTTYRTTPWQCPSCGEMLDAAQYMGGVSVDSLGRQAECDPPSPGAFSICMECATILQFEEGMRLCVARDEDLADAPIEFLEIIQKVIESVGLMHAARGTKPATDVKRMN